ncbi:MAG TPA: hypothetical protein VGX28_09390 [Frankiaceae bacterium]|jgi:hypothetical protein|nr:hypothetical protein [Frankiaceae bacterium]
MRIRARLALAALPAALLPLAPVPVSASDAVYGNVATWTGRAKFGDDGITVIVTGTTDLGTCQDLVGAALVRINRCRATISGSYEKQGNGTTRLCAGVGNGDVYFTDSASLTQHIPVLLVASDGAITYSGRYVDAFGRETVSVEGVVEGACGTSRAWSGTLDSYRG